MIRTGTYRDREDNLVRVQRTATGYVVTREDGSTTVIGDVS